MNVCIFLTFVYFNAASMNQTLTKEILNFYLNFHFKQGCGFGSMFFGRVRLKVGSGSSVYIGSGVVFSLVNTFKIS